MHPLCQQLATAAIKSAIEFERPGTAATMAGAALMAGGAATLPAAMPMMRLAAKGFGKRMLDNKELMRYMPDEIGSRLNKMDMSPASFVADYIESPKRLAALGIRGGVVDKIHRGVSKLLKPGSPSHGLDDYARSHYDRFTSGSSRSAMGHWAFELDMLKRHKWIEKRAKSMGMTADDYYAKLKSGELVPMKAADGSTVSQALPDWKPMAAARANNAAGDLIRRQGGLLDQQMYKGVTEHAAIKNLRNLTPEDVLRADPTLSPRAAAKMVKHVEQHLEGMAVMNLDPAQRYGTQAMMSPGAIAAGGGLAFAPRPGFSPSSQ